MIRAATLIAAFLGAPAFAAECDLMPDGVALLLAARHVNEVRKFEEFVPGLYVALDCGDATVHLGGHSNSLGRYSVAGTATHRDLQASWYGFQAGPFAGLMYQQGDEERGDLIGWMPIAGINVTHDVIPAFIQILPGDGKDFDVLISAGLQWRF